MIDLRDRRRLVLELLIAELLARPGRPGPLARPRWLKRAPIAPVPTPAPAAPAPPAARPDPQGER